MADCRARGGHNHVAQDGTWAPCTCLEPLDHAGDHICGYVMCRHRWPRTVAVQLVKRSLQERCGRWHEAKFPFDDLWKQLVKLGEEAGEVNRAFIGHAEGREGRGDRAQELAQVILVCLTLAERRLDGVDLMARVEQELTDQEVALAFEQAADGRLP